MEVAFTIVFAILFVAAAGFLLRRSWRLQGKAIRRAEDAFLDGTDERRDPPPH